MKAWLPSLLFLCLLSPLLSSCGDEDEDVLETNIPETDKDPTTGMFGGAIFRPGVQMTTDELVQQLKVPTGFKVNKFADGMGKPRIMAINSAGQVYVTDREAGVVMLLQDTNGDGLSDQKTTVANIPQAHGLAMYNGKLYVVAVKELYSFTMNMDGSLTNKETLITDLPDGGQHPNRTIAFGPDNMLYISVGSTCNSCPEPNPENATMLIANPNGTDRKVFAKGLRNTIGFGWHPQTGELWGMDHGIDWLGDDEQKEELNKIVRGANYGWPYIYGEGKYNPGDRPKGDTTYQQYLQLTTLPSLTYQAHAAPMAMAYYTGTQFPAEYQNDALVAMRGSWNRTSPVGYKVVRVHFENGQPTRFDDFLTGFLINGNTHHFARLVGVAVNPRDGSLLVSDDTNGVIYRVSRQ